MPTQTEIETTVEDILAVFEDDDSINPDYEDIKTQIENLITEYKVPIGEAERSVRSNLVQDSDKDAGSLVGDGNERVTVDSIQQAHNQSGTGDGAFVTLEAEVVELWDPSADSIAQVGLIGDETDRTKFVRWDKSDVTFTNTEPELREGNVYEFADVATSEYEGQYSVSINSTTEVTELEKNITVVDNSEAIVAPIVQIRQQSGIVKRCNRDSCTRVLDWKNDNCPEHGPQTDPNMDFRTKAVVDTGEEVIEAVLDEEQTEAVTGIDFETALSMVEDSLDREVPEEKLTEQLVGRYFKFEGNLINNEDSDDTIVVESAVQDPVDPEQKAEQLLDRLTELKI